MTNKFFPRAKLLGSTAILLYLGAVKFTAHPIFNNRYGYFRDELFTIICGERLAFGFVDHPPLTPLIARFSRILFGDSLLGLRVFPALAGAATVVLAGLIVRRLGGGRFAQALAGLTVILSGVILAFGAMLTNNAFDILFWTLAAYLLVIILKDNRPRLWLIFGLVTGIALQNKYSIAFFVTALGLGLLLSSARKEFGSVWLWAGGGVAFLIFLPNLIWQISHGLPFIELNRNAVLMKNAPLTPLQFLGSQVLETLPWTFVLILTGFLFFMLSPGMKPFRVFGWAYLALSVFFVFSGGKSYYLAPVYPVMIAAGATAVERFSLKRRGSLLLRPVSVCLILTHIAALPFTLPVFPVDTFIAYSATLGMAPKPMERQPTGVLPQYYADQFGWEEMTQTVAEVYRALPVMDKKECGIFTQNYGEASAINFFGRRLGLPPAVCTHNNYWLWGPGAKSGSVLIVVGGKREDHLAAFSEVTEAAVIHNRYAMPYETNLPVFVCRGLKVPIREIWLRNKNFI